MPVHKASVVRGVSDSSAAGFGCLFLTRSRLKMENRKWKGPWESKIYSGTQPEPASQPRIRAGVHTTVRPLSPSLGEPGVCLSRLSNRSIACRWIAECQWHQKPNIGFS